MAEGIAQIPSPIRKPAVMQMDAAGQQVPQQHNSEHPSPMPVEQARAQHAAQQAQAGAAACLQALPSPAPTTGPYTTAPCGLTHSQMCMMTDPSQKSMALLAPM
jgi:hypothetical protein